MSEERTKILRMLEQGKITADQAARLIEALGHRRFHSGPDRFARRIHRRVSLSELDRIPDIVASAVSSAVKTGFQERSEVKTDFPGKHSLFLKSISGDVEVSAWDEDKISLEKPGGMTKVRERENRVMVRSISGDITVFVPRESKLELVSVSGNVEVTGMSGKLGLKSVSGDVGLSDLTGELKADVVSGDLKMIRVSGELLVESKSGDIELEPVGEFSGKISSKSGDIEVRLYPDADVVLDMECEEKGAITLDMGFPYEILEKDERLLKVKLGSGTRVLKLRTRKADITVRETKED
ncbi:hypothetical protein CH330_02960 [candidate division WOR-3 bacterium JGI_Cruoil_03_51_56]|uniref:Uncharacterized protein n=1 Tax=candidate division WOR-3 bacterium JGI_Cruoil_03_51_56 TaxID=1973747 RepID=A0A235BVY4_UNCW3|nr:MAG: hypothetical protein CH330_02960 [candidate division WOR-3 bacterium JGI_Cruoil_03_51_56]